ncbi:hypothetical protein [Roseivirga sp. E12]|uniref:hypothetical protein n=1 Tax=Roseivirga sp. E12 TaxID=2819237 RepID=UPI001ABC0755|nr:hypothetical protein [Roseivirga sp. E12]MBO3698619.1 hypothetical protein [Roseivirga sp. E12]
MNIRTIALLLILPIFSCDRFAEDALPVLDARFEINANATFIINPAQIMNRQIGEVRLVSSPSQGSVEIIDGQAFLKYTPRPDFLDGEDLFKISATDLNGFVREVNVVLEVDQSVCIYKSVFDYVPVERSRSVTVDLFENDSFCGNVLDVQSATIVQSNIPTADFTNLDWISLSIDPNTNQALLQVDAGLDVGVVKLLYEIGVNLKAGNETYFEGSLAINPNSFEHYFVAEVTVEVIR